tara:strand:+ start:809 stop:3163 length:2355 start_codon:yes stop_codon:yes gene_type:complete
MLNQDNEDSDELSLYRTKEATRWKAELGFAEKEDKEWLARSKKIVKRYRDMRSGRADNNKKYNILWSNIQTTLPALYGRTPRAQVDRRWKDKDDAGRTASIILERALQYEIDHYGDFDMANRAAVLDRLLCGRGTAWVRFENKEIETIDSKEVVQVGNSMEVSDDASEMPDPLNQLEANPTVDKPENNYQCTPVDYVYWEDFRCSPARTWDEVTWVARRVYMSKEAGIARFGKIFEKAPLSHEPIGLDEMRSNGSTETELENLKKAKVWEIWDKSTERVYWLAEGQAEILDSKEDPYGLDEFWPCPKPIFATQTTDTIVPVPDYALYQDQADEMDRLTNRIAQLTEAVKVVGVYDANQTGVERMLTEGSNNTLIPVSNWGALTSQGGISKVIEFLPLDMVLQALRECYAAREQAKQVIYEITGLSDIIRGASVASETATAQQIKSQYASLRLRRLQHDVAEFSSSILRIKAQMMADLYSPQNLIQMSGIMGTDDAQYAEQALQLLQTEPARNFRVEIASDSLVEMDEQAEKASRTEFMQAFGSVMRDALPMLQQAPELGPLMGEVLTFVVRTFRGGRTLENVLESTIQKMNEPKPPPQQPPPDPQLQIEQGRMQLEQAKMQQSAQLEQLKMQAEMQKDQAKAQLESQLEKQRKQYDLAITEAKMNHELHLKQMDLDIKRMDIQSKKESDSEKAELDASTKILVAQISAQQASESLLRAEEAANNEVAHALNPLEELTDMHAKMMDGMNGVMMALKAPKVRKVIIGTDGNPESIEESGGIIEVQS